MFSYLRYFAIISFVVVVLAAALLGAYFRSIAYGDLADVAEQSNISLAQGYINTTWKTHLPNIKRLSALEANLWSRYKEFVSFSEDTFRHFEGIPVTQFNIYTPRGERVLSVNQDADIRYNSGTAITALPENNPLRRAFTKALQGEYASRTIEDSEFQSPSGETVRGAVVQSFIPILPDSYSAVIAGADVQVEGVVEVFYDITPQWEKLYLFQLVGTGGILTIFVILLGALFFTSKKAESIITTQHEANVELAATAAKAEAESRQKSQFLANVSHELRTPLNAIIGFSEIIRNEVMGPLQNETYMNYIKDIHSSGVHLLSLINDILDFSKAEAGKLELHLSELDATKLIKNCMRLVSPRAEQARVNLVTEVPNEHFIITGDAKKLKQVLLNLLSNAVKFTPENGTVKVTAWQNVMDDSISIEVKDSGIGIAPKDISRAMSPFGQVDSALSRKYEGTGLGLPLSKKFVEIMGGTFRIESELGAGTTITISVPLTPPRHVLRAAAKAHEEEAATPRPKQVSPQLMAHAALMQADDSTTPPPVTPLAAATAVPIPPLPQMQEGVNPSAQPDAGHTMTPPFAPSPLVPPAPTQQGTAPALMTPPAPAAAQDEAGLLPTPSLTAGRSLEMDMATYEEMPAAPAAPESGTNPFSAGTVDVPPAPPEAPVYGEAAYGDTATAALTGGDTPLQQTEPSVAEHPAESAPQPEPAASGSGEQKFMSYADLKRLAQQQNKPSGDV